MKITNDPARIQPAAVERAAATRPAPKAADVKPAERPGQPAARGDFSARAREPQAAHAAAKPAPDVREDKLADARQRIENGTDRVDAEAIARRMLARRA